MMVVLFKKIAIKIYSLIMYIPVINKLIYKLVYKAYLTKKVNIIKGKKGWKMVFITDTHWGANKKQSSVMIRELEKKANIDAIVFGGDFITHFDTDKEKMIQLGIDCVQQISGECCDFFPIIGNHDNNSYLQTNPKAILSNEEVSRILQVRTDKKAEYYNHFNYCIDIDEHNLRLLFLDTSTRQKDANRNAFIREKLESTPDTYRVIVMAHIWEEWCGGEKCYHKNACTEDIIALLDEYNSRREADANDTLVQRKVSFVLGGHIHNDFQTKTETNIPIILCDCDCDEKCFSGNVIAKTPYEQCLTVINIEKEKAEFIRVGRGRSSYTIKL